ncbi:MAG: DUF1109 domain-containing protein [Halothiobacillaceae bacterium]|jgi:hypothetical protein|nr:MAG: DUF1109 domain-containing protein [Halothiobacillaceae bacterium]
MKTDDLVMLLAAGEGPVPSHAAARRFAPALGLGMLVAGLMMVGLLGVRPDLAEAARLPMFWVKLGYVAILAVVSLMAVLRLSRPGVRLDKVPAALVASVLSMWVLAAFVLIHAEPAQRMGMVFGNTWKECPSLIAMLSLPIFAATLWAMRGLAPTRLKWAGAAAGFLSGSMGAVIYSLHCPNLDAPFIGTWYLLGILIPTLVGALLGPRLLRW